MNKHDVSMQTSPQNSRQVSPLTAKATSPIPQQRPMPFYQRALLYSIPVGAAGVLGTLYGNKIYSTMKELANYGKRLSVNALAAIRGTPYYIPTNYTTSSASSGVPSRSPSPTPRPSPTGLPTATPDPRHPKTGVQIYYPH